MNTNDLAWAAGFFDGEGSFSLQRGSKTSPNSALPRLEIGQKNKEPLERFQNIFDCGTIRNSKTPKGKPFYVYAVCSVSNVEYIKESIYPYLTSIKQDQADRVFSESTYTGGNKAKTHCKHGHEFTKENTYVYNGHRQCKTCRKEIQNGK